MVPFPNVGIPIRTARSLSFRAAATTSAADAVSASISTTTGRSTAFTPLSDENTRRGDLPELPLGGHDQPGREEQPGDLDPGHERPAVVPPQVEDDGPHPVEPEGGDHLREFVRRRSPELVDPGRTRSRRPSSPAARRTPWERRPGGGRRPGA